MRPVAISISLGAGPAQEHGARDLQVSFLILSLNTFYPSSNPTSNRATLYFLFLVHLLGSLFNAFHSLFMAFLHFERRQHIWDSTLASQWVYCPQTSHKHAY